MREFNHLFDRTNSQGDGSTGGSHQNSDALHRRLAGLDRPTSTFTKHMNPDSSTSGIKNNDRCLSDEQRNNKQITREKLEISEISLMNKQTHQYTLERRKETHQEEPLRGKLELNEQEEDKDLTKKEIDKRLERLLKIKEEYESADAHKKGFLEKHARLDVLVFLEEKINEDGNNSKKHIDTYIRKISDFIFYYKQYMPDTIYSKIMCDIQYCQGLEVNKDHRKDIKEIQNEEIYTKLKEISKTVYRKRILKKFARRAARNVVNLLVYLCDNGYPPTFHSWGNPF